jgi:hypothetical protein
VQLEPKPAAVDDHYRYSDSAPPELSARCHYWVRQIERGWLPNRAWRTEGYDTASESLYGVYIWEYLNVLMPLVVEAMERADP